MSELKLNGNGFPKVSASTFALLMNLVVLVVGLGALWGTQVSRIDDLKERLITVQARLDVHERALNEERQTITNRLTGLEADTKYISATLNELKLKFK
jgi:hypothetical protein